MTDESGSSPGDEPGQRRGFFARAAGVAMLGGLVAGYGGLAAVAARYLYPSKRRDDDESWLFVSDVVALALGDSLEYESPAGARAVIARQGESGGAEDFIALSSVCPHLGCIVQWEAQNGRFFCPCHNGTFDRAGKGTGGPPGKAGQALSRYPLKVERGLLFIKMPPAQLSQADHAGCGATPGHDPCLGGLTPLRLSKGPERRG